ncbi:MAG: DUF423 domain-containing protein [Ignavibacteria bacterium]|nr:DUF423 domain-containing protein [Ignavibacteria bacterium]
MTRRFFILGAIFGFIGVAAGAFGAHILRDYLDADRISLFETGVRYQMYHAFALLLIGFARRRYDHRALFWSGWCFAIGIVLFSGSLYALAVTGMRWLGMIAPAGGISFLMGWLLFAWGLWKGRVSPI